MTATPELEDQAARSPPAMRPSQVANYRLDLGADPPRMRLRRVRPVSQPVKTALAVTGHPPVCTVRRATPKRSATSVIGMPSRTCNTAWYLCSTTFNSRSIAGVSRIK